MRESIIDRIQGLIIEGQLITKNIYLIEWGTAFRKWRLGCLNILEKTFGKESDAYTSFKNITNASNKEVWVPNGIAVLEAAKEIIEKGFLYKIQHLVTADFFDSVLEQAEYLLSEGHKDPAAILGRVIVEQTLKQIAEREAVISSEKMKLSAINDCLRKEGIYDKIKWRLIQGYIDLGNDAAHGHFDKYTDKQVEEMLDWIKKNLMSL
jgi:hypothetical protein